MTLNHTDRSILKESLLYLHVHELKEIATRLALSDKGNKMTIVMRILHYLERGEKLTLPKFPEKSCAKRGQEYPLDKNTFMLKGSYRNDLKTRQFFKQLIGEYFHFTAFGIDWLNERWMEGNPPTYHEFAIMWQKEFQARQKSPVAPKEEWAYINFVKKHQLSSPNASKELVNKAWEDERLKHKTIVYEWIDNRVDHVS